MNSSVRLKIHTCSTGLLDDLYKISTIPVGQIPACKFYFQVNLVCGKALLISDAQTVYYFGVLVGSIVLGQLSDL